MHVVLCALNARYTHTNLAVRTLRAWNHLHGQNKADCMVREWTINDRFMPLLKRLYRENADVYAFSCYIWNSPLVMRLVRELKKLCPQSVMILGGPEASTRAEEILTLEPAVDYVILGEGEWPFTNLLDALERQETRKKISSNIQGLAFRGPDKAIQIRASSAFIPGENWPFPYSQEDLEQNRNRIFYYESSRGCPFQCAYCLSSLDRTVRYRPLDQVKRDLDAFIQADVRQVKFVDRTFNINQQRARAIWQHLLDRYRERPFRTNFHFELVGDRLDSQSIELLASAPLDLFQLEIGVQSAHADVLESVNRTCDLDQLAENAKAIRDSGNIHVHLDLIAGLPGEDLDRFSQSFDWVYRLNPDYLQLGFLKVLPGTMMETIAKKAGYLWLDDPPYEIMQTDDMRFSDFCKLKNIERLVDDYVNTALCHDAARWLCDRWPSPWRFFEAFAAWLEKQGGFDRSVGAQERFRLLWDFARASGQLPDVQDQTMFRDLLRVCFQKGGQKSRPEWMGFWETMPRSKDSELIRYVRLQASAAQNDHSIRYDGIHFNFEHYGKTGDLVYEPWLVLLKSSGQTVSVVKARPVSVLGPCSS